MAEPKEVSLPVLRDTPVDEGKLLACIHCGLCLPSCPTHVISGKEMPSPRGRLYLMRAVMEGRISETEDAYAEHEWSCLVCRACETACPSGVEFGYLMEQAREGLRKKKNPSPLRSFIYKKLLPNRSLLNVMQGSLAVISALKLTALSHSVGKAISNTFPKVGSALRLLPAKIQAPVSRPELHKSQPDTRGTVGLLLGCIGEVFTSEINTATIRVLTKLGWNVKIISNTTCCGALAIHAGYRETALELSSNMITQVHQSEVEYFISNIAGCGAMLKDYEHLFEGTSKEHEAQEFRDKVRDIAEFLVENHKDELKTLGLKSKQPLTVGYHAACHLFHAQKVQQEPQDLLSLVQNITVIPLPENELCCGSAGSYNIEQPEEATTLLERKMDILKQVHPDIVVTGNAGCLMQLQKGVREKGDGPEVLHIIQFIDKLLNGI